MFTGIITSIGTIISAREAGDFTVTISCPWNDLRIGESIACNGACLTVVECGWWIVNGEISTITHQPPTTNHQPPVFTVQLSSETLHCTAPRWVMGEKVNLERAMKLGDALDGHLVTGHVDGLATITTISRDGDSHVLMLEAPAALSRFIAAKGSVTLDGVSLTVNKAEGNKFWVNIIPHTWDVTTLGSRVPGDRLNMEIDLIARYVERLLGNKNAA